MRSKTSQDAQRIDERIDRLALLVHAMWTLLREKTNVTEEELRKRMTELDAQDGAVDGRVARPPVRCACGAMMSRKFRRCLFCGREDTSGSPIDAV